MREMADSISQSRVDAETIREACLPVLRDEARRDIKSTVEHMREAFRSALAQYTIQLYQFAGAHMQPVLQVVAAIQEKVDDPALLLAREASEPPSSATSARTSSAEPPSTTEMRRGGSIILMPQNDFV